MVKADGYFIFQHNSIMIRFFCISTTLSILFHLTSRSVLIHRVRASLNTINKPIMCCKFVNRWRNKTIWNINFICYGLKTAICFLKIHLKKELQSTKKRKQSYCSFAIGKFLIDLFDQIRLMKFWQANSNQCGFVFFHSYEKLAEINERIFPDFRDGWVFFKKNELSQAMKHN